VAVGSVALITAIYVRRRQLCCGHHPLGRGSVV